MKQPREQGRTVRVGSGTLRRLVEANYVAEVRVEVLIPISLFFSVAAVLILRPMTSKVGLILEAMSRERMPAPPPAEREDTRVVTLLEQISRRLDMMEERVDFTERLVSARPGEEPLRSLSRRSHAQVAEY